MPKRKKQSKHCSAAAKKRWNNTKSNPKLSDTEESSDDQPNNNQNDDQLSFDATWMENENEPLSDDQFTEELGRVQVDALEKLVKNARQSDAWVVKGRKPIYTGLAESTLRNKRAAWRKAASGSSKITNWLPVNNASSDYELPFETIESSDEEDNSFTLASLDALLKKNSDVRLRIVSQFLHLIQDQEFSKLSASDLLARSVNRGPWHARVIRSWAKQWSKRGEIITSRRGRHPKIKSLLLDEDFKLRVTQYLRANKFTVTIQQFIKFIEDEAIPSLGIETRKTIGERTAQKWLHHLGWDYKDHSKDIYFDGHEREDVVAYRNEFLQQMAGLRPRIAVYEGQNMDQIISPILPTNVPELVPITHDESIFYANDGIVKTWGPIEENQLRRKSQGLSVHVSEFICESIGRLRLSEEEKITNDLLPEDNRLLYTEACVIMHPGSNRDGWWTNQDLINQVVDRAIPIFERTHPGKIALFMFDNSCNHNAYAEDALVVSRMNLKDGGKQPLLRNGKMPDGSPHNLTFVDVDGVTKPKGIKRILEERGLWLEGLAKQCSACKSHAFDPMNPQCCASGILGHQPDFASQKNHTQEVIEAAGHMCVFYPKFHCELNFIESFWGEAKRYARLHCDYSFKGLKAIVPLALDSVGLFNIRRYARRSGRYMSAYEQGLSGKAAVFAVKKYKSHRRVPESVLQEFGHMN
jgi:hypothetical protein